MKSTTFPIERLESRIAPAGAALLDLTKFAAPNGVELLGEVGKDFAGSAVSGIGDVNGDGFDDVVIGAFGADPNGHSAAGAAYVVFGARGGFPTKLNLSALDGAKGFKLQGNLLGDNAGYSASAAGDVNGDGIDDFVIGAPEADPNGHESAGKIYVIFGRNTSVAPFAATLDLETLNGTNGFRILGEETSAQAGASVSAGDINGDGFSDILIGAPYAAASASGSGAAYLVLGHKASVTPFAPALNLATLSAGDGFKFTGAPANSLAGKSVAVVGDVNGDGFNDMVIGAPTRGSTLGSAYVVFGRSNAITPFAPFDLSTVDGNTGFKLLGEANIDNAGRGVSSAGDINGDGFGDLIVGAQFNSTGGVRGGAAYVVLGRNAATTPFAASLALASLDGTNGFKISGAAQDSNFGVNVSSAGDLNGDGFSDVLIGAPYDVDTKGLKVGASYVVYGRDNSTAAFAATLAASALDGANGYKILGNSKDNGGTKIVGGFTKPAPGDNLGRSIGSAGDFNGDGLDDLILGATFASVADFESGAAYVLFSGPGTLTAKTLTYTDVDGDIATVKISKGTLERAYIDLVPQGLGYKLSGLDFHADPLLTKSNITVSAKKVKGGSGNGVADVDAINAQNLDLGAVSVSGRLEQVFAGTGLVDPKGKPLVAIPSLTVDTLGESLSVGGAIAAYQSIIHGPLGVLTVKHDVRNVFVEVLGATGTIGKISIGGDFVGDGSDANDGLIEAAAGIGAVAVKGNITGGSDHAGLRSGGKLGKVTVGGALTSANPAKPVTISALGKTGATKTSDAVAIAGLSVKGDVLDARILAGYDLDLIALNPDASIGAVSVGGGWAASSLVAGVKDATGDGFGRNDTLIGGDTTQTIFATIASITIKGQATGSGNLAEFYGITAQRLTKLSIGKATTVFAAGNTEDFPLTVPPNNFHAVDFA